MTVTSRVNDLNVWLSYFVSYYLLSLVLDTDTALILSKGFFDI